MAASLRSPHLRKQPFVLTLRRMGDVFAGYLFPYVIIEFGGMLRSRLLAVVTVLTCS